MFQGRDRVGIPDAVAGAVSGERESRYNGVGMAWRGTNPARFVTMATAFVMMMASSATGGAADELRPARGNPLRVYVEGVRNSKGVIGYLVFDSSRGWPDTIKDTVRMDAMPAHEGTVLLEIPNLRTGDYGLVVIHDENSNKKLDRDWKGSPTEQWGMSNNPRAYLSAPPYDRAKFHIEHAMDLHIVLK
jgi:uncharacterized protein (DUF2141 family)